MIVEAIPFNENYINTREMLLGISHTTKSTYTNGKGIEIEEFNNVKAFLVDIPKDWDNVVYDVVHYDPTTKPRFNARFHCGIHEFLLETNERSLLKTVIKRLYAGQDCFIEDLQEEIPEEFV